MSNEFETAGVSASVRYCQKTVAMTANRKPAVPQLQVSETMTDSEISWTFVSTLATLFVIVLKGHNYYLCN